MRRLTRVLCLAPLLALGCGESTEGVAGDDEPIFGTHDQLTSGAPETCATGTPAATITGNGVHRSPDGNYNPAGCSRGYKIDVNNYTPGVMGALAAYGEVAPATQAECIRSRLVTIVWRRNSDGTTTLLGEDTRFGRWVDAGFGGKRCATPSLDLTEKLGTALARRGNYRVGVQARIGPSPDGTVPAVYKQVLLSIPAAVPETSPSNTIAVANTLANSIAALPSAALHPAALQLWAVRDLPVTRGVACRTWDTLLTAYRITATELKKMIPSTQAALADRRTQTLQNIRDKICNNPFPSASDINDLQNTMLTDLRWGGEMQTQIMNHMGVAATDAADLIAQSFALGVQRLAVRCRAVPEQIRDFISFGTVPAGKVGANLLQGNCTGTAAQIAGAAGIAVDTGGDQRTKYKACMDAQASALEASQCTGPASSSPSNADPNDNPADRDGFCKLGEVWDADTDTCGAPKDSLTAEQIRQLTEENENYEESVRRSQGHAEIAAIHAEIATAFGGAALVAGGTVVGAPAAGTLGVMSGIEAVQAGFFKIISLAQAYSAERSLETICRIDRADPRCEGRSKNRCVEYDLAGDKAWFQTAPNSFFPDGRETTRFDKFQDCSCELFEKDYGSLPSAYVFGGPTSWCNQTAEERQIQECLRNPEEPNGKPKTACMNLLQPKEIDRDAMLARWCHDKMPNCDGAYVDDTGNCACPGGGNGFPVAGPPSCQNANATNCGADGFFNERTCQCVPYDAGLGCARGGMAGYLTKNPSDIFTAIFPQESTLSNRNFLMAASGNTPFATTLVKKAGLKNKTSLSLAVRLPATTLPSGYQGWAAQISCSNPGLGTQNRSLQTVQFQGMSAGLNTFTIPLNADQRLACFNNDATEARFEIRSNNQVGQPRIGFEDFVRTNGLLDRSGVFPLDACNVPAPGPLPPVDPLPFGKLFTLPSWTFSDGVLTTNPIRR